MDVPGDPRHLEPIELSVREEIAPDHAQLVVRAGPLTLEKLLQHARREQSRYSYRGRPMPSISVDVTVHGWTVESILRERLWSRSTYATSRVEDIRGAGFALLPTFETPHYDVVLPAPTTAAVGILLELFGAPVKNPYRRRRR
jgi:hypothetical protein